MDVLPLPSPDGALSGLRRSLQRRLSVQRVLIAVGSEGLTCAWSSQGSWLWTQAHWPEGACRLGLPEIPEAMADLIADTLLDLGLLGARVELLLPLDLCQWRVIDGHLSGQSLPCNDVRLRQLPWSLDPDDCYISTFDCFGSLLAVGLSRSGLQAWIDVFEQADLCLDRVDWLISAAWRGALQETSHQSSSLAWVVAHEQQKRLILLRHGVPEVDRIFDDQTEQWLQNVSDFVRVWRETDHADSSVQWLVTAPQSIRAQMNRSMGFCADIGSADSSQLFEHRGIDSLADPQLMDPLVSLGFVGLGLAR